MRWQDRAPCSLTVSRDCEALLFFVRPLEKVSLSLHVEQECAKNSESPWERGNSDKQVWFRSFLRVGNSTLLLTRAAKESLCPDNERTLDLADFGNLYVEFWLWRCVHWRFARA